MSFTSGFFNALNNDRTYDSVQMSQLFDGLIHDGIFSSVGGKMMVTPGTGMSVRIASGRGWFLHTWSYNDTVMVINLDQSEVLLNRIDAIVLEVNGTVEVRKNSIRYIKGTPATNAVKPTLINTEKHKQYPLAFIFVPKGITAIAAEHIENMIGTTATPFATGVVASVTTDQLLAQWNAQFDVWFQRMKDQLSTDAAGNLQNQIDNLSGPITNIQNSITSLEKDTVNKSFSVTLTSAGWTGASSPYSQTVPVSGIYADDWAYLVSPNEASYSAWGSNGVRLSSLADNSLTFRSTNKPTGNIQATILGLQLINRLIVFP